MKYIKLDLLTLLISLFILSSCEKTGTIGLDIAPQDSIKSIFTDAITVHSVTVKEDSVSTSNISQNPFGFLTDPIFGTTEANLALGLNLPSDNYSFGSNPTLDSAVLVLKYGDEFYGDSLTSNYIINVHQLKPTFNTSINYFNTNKWGDYTSDPVRGSSPIVKRFAWNDSTTINTIVKGGPDKSAVVAPQIRIKLDAAFITTNFLNAGSARLKNNTTFSSFIKGLYVRINKNQSTGNGGIIFFNLQSTISALEIYYKTPNGAAIDSNVAIFKAVGASEIKHNHGTAIQAQLNNPSQNSATVYVQPLAGLRTKLNFPDLKGLKNEGNISVNKAELVISVDEGSVNFFKPAPRLTLYQLDIAGQRKAVPDNAIGGTDARFLDERIFGGFYNASSKTYTFNITSYIHDLINKPIIQYDTFIAPIDLPLTGRSNIFPAATTAARSVLGPIKLKLTYTKPN
ncbi:DUF4270 domain-containing protein [Pedobacter sp. P351]|uniref:DUF4270 domain-containing protein n=1 Tax=Pedobacter superstes TaxID=3133441 RepID=UPI00309624CF